MGTDSEAVQLRSIAQLQQRAAALEQELQLRHGAESRLAERERELSDLVDNCIVGLHRVGPDGTILWANRAELEMLGYGEHEYVGRNISDFYVDRVLVADILRRLSGGEAIHDQPVKMLCKDGSIRHVLVTSNALMEDGRLVSTRCFTRDVTDRWFAQEALRERGGLLHLAMQGARMGYWIADLDRKQVRGSPELAELFGLSGPFDWPLESFVALMHPDDRDGFEQSFRAAIEGRGMFQHEFRVRHELSDWRWYEGRGESVYDQSGTPVRLSGVCMDVTARKREQHLLMHLAAVVDSADDAIISKNLDGIVLSWNTGAMRLFGYEPAEMIGRPITTVIPPELFGEEAVILGRLRRGERIEHFVTTRVAKDGTRKRVSLSVSPVRDAAGRIVAASKIARKLPDAG